jgi:DNA-binding CsgD family transcriptional regulator
VLAPVDGTWRWTGSLSGATRLVGLVSDRLDACTPAERRMLELLALGEPLPAGVVAELAPAELIAELEGRQLVSVDRRERAADVAVVRLARPLYGEVLRNELPSFTARGHHRALADAGLRSGFHRRHPLRAATWVLEAGAGAGPPELLLRGSHVALQTDDYELSERLARAAAHAGGGWPARLRQAEALGPLRRWEEADALLDEVAHEGNGPAARAAAAQIRAEQSFWHRGDDVGVARRIVADAAASVGSPLRSSLLMHGAWYAQMALELDESIHLATEAAAAADTLDDRLNGVGCIALAAVFLGRTTVALDLVRLAGAQAMQVVETAPMAGGYLAFAYSFASFLDGRVDETVRFFTSYRRHEVARLAGTPGALSSAWLANAVLAQGRVATATELAREALGRFGDENHFGRGTWIAATLATAAAQSGDGETAASALAWIDSRRRPAVRADDLLADRARAWVLAERGELSGAVEAALDVAGRARAAGAPMFEVLALLDAVRFGGVAPAAERLGELTGVVGGRLVGVIADFARAAASGDGDALDELATRFAGTGALLLAAEASTVAAGAHHGAGRRRSAAASRAAAQGWHARCEGAVTPLLTGLDAVPLVTTLTRREHEIAGMAARGRTSRQIAEALTISIRTVDSHLNHAYTKLGIRDRVELATALGRDDPG